MFVIGVILFQRVYMRLPLDSTNMFGWFVIAMNISYKSLHDSIQWNHNDLVRTAFGGLDLKTFNQFERTFLAESKFLVFVSDSEYYDALKSMQQFANDEQRNVSYNLCQLFLTTLLPSACITLDDMIELSDLPKRKRVKVLY